MSTMDDRLARRLTAISAAKPVAAPPPLADPTASAPRRKETREQTYRFARVEIGRRTVVRCIIKDTSPSGARIAMEGAFDLPEEVVLAIDQTGRRFRARVAWRRENEAGLMLLQQIRAEPGDSRTATGKVAGGANSSA